MRALRKERRRHNCKSPRLLRPLELEIGTIRNLGLKMMRACRDWKSVSALADHFGVSMDYLAGRTDRRDVWK